jgi:NADPH2:quinone reductase
MLQTAHGSLTVGLDLRAGQTLLVHGGTSSIGMAATVLAKRTGASVISTTRNPTSVERLVEIGADRVLVDDGPLAERVREMVPEGVDAALELVGTPTIFECLAATRVHGTVCMSGMLSNQPAKHLLLGLHGGRVPCLGDLAHLCHHVCFSPSG